MFSAAVGLQCGVSLLAATLSIHAITLVASATELDLHGELVLLQTVAQVTETEHCKESKECHSGFHCDQSKGMCTDKEIRVEPPSPFKDSATAMHSSGHMDFIATRLPPARNATCKDGRLKYFGSQMIVVPYKDKNILYCAVPKVATRSTFNVIAALTHHGGGDPSNHWTSVNDFIKQGRGEELCDMYSFVFIRNPWDRTYSAYHDKVEGGEVRGSTKYRPFVKFVSVVEKTDPTLMNMHWMPYSTHCAMNGPEKHDFTDVFKLEDDYEGSLVKALEHLGFSAAQTEVELQKIGTKNQHTNDKDQPDVTPEQFRKIMYQGSMLPVMEKVYKDDIEWGHYEI